MFIYRSATTTTTTIFIHDGGDDHTAANKSNNNFVVESFQFCQGPIFTLSSSLLSSRRQQQRHSKRQNHRHGRFFVEERSAFDNKITTTTIFHRNVKVNSDALSNSVAATTATTITGIVTDTSRNDGGESISAATILPSSRSNVLPPWLARFEDSDPIEVLCEVQKLEDQLTTEHCLSSEDVADIIKAIYLCAAGNVPTILGSVSFCLLMLQLEKSEDGHHNSHHQDGSKKESSGDGIHCTVTESSSDSPSSVRPTKTFVSKDVLLSSILHYSECVKARYEGGYDRLLRLALLRRQQQQQQQKASTSSSSTSTQIVLAKRSDIDNILDEDCSSLFSMSTSSSFRSKLKSLANRNVAGQVEEAYREIFTAESLRLADQASKLKRAEIMASVLQTGPMTMDESSNIADLLVSVSDDWRALAIRCVASWYRLDGVVSSMPHATGEFLPRTQEATLTAKDSLRIYASLAQRLGLQRLKTNLESNAFRILYPRQYSAASTLFLEHGVAMNAVSKYLENQLTRLLVDDRYLMSELEDLQVTSRVKEPYSFWKKLLKQRGKSRKHIDMLRSSAMSLQASSAKELLITEVNDGVALRVILKARKLNEDETIESLRMRERLLCYYVQKQILSKWPDASRIKDYIRNPKPNGYQSLHHTSKISRNRKDFHFEVQIRSEEMHRIAEFGLAAHWTYKSKIVLPPSTDSKISIVSSATANSAYIEALEEQRANLSKTKCYVFTASSQSFEGGRLLTVDVGSTVLDVLNRLQSTDSFLRVKEELQVYRNGGIAQLDDQVSNGDMLLLQSLESSYQVKPDAEINNVRQGELMASPS